MTPGPPLIVVVAYGQPGLLAHCLSSLEGRHQVVVVDNSRRADVRTVVEDGGATYVCPDRNLGFAAGVNVGLKHALADQDVLLLNPDASLDTEGLKQLSHALAPGVAAAAPLLVRPDGSPERTVWPMPTPLAPWAGLLGMADRFGDETFLSGAALMLSGRAIADVGMFDERFFLYAEESDWQRRALRRGWSLVVCDKVTATHVGGATSDDPAGREVLFHRSAEAFIRKWHGTGGWYVFRAGAFASAARRFLLARSAADRAGARRTLGIYGLGRQRAVPSGRYDA